MAKSTSVSAFKDAALERLRQKGETENHYPIEPADLTSLTKCPICNSADLAPVASVQLADGLEFFNTCVCSNCLFTFRRLFPSYRWFQSCWSRIATGNVDVFNHDLEELRRKRYQDYLDLVRPKLPTGRVLDIGAAYGTGSKLFADAGYVVEALEPENDRALYIQKRLGIPVHSASFEDFTPPERYNLIISAHNLEHLDDPIAAVAQMRNWLVPGGLLYLEVPLLWNIVDWSDGLFLAHKSNFLESNLAAMLQRAGFQLVLKHYPARNNADHPDIGLLLAHGEATSGTTAWDDDRAGRSVADIRRLYRRDLPFADAMPPDAPLRYRVPYVNHFYYSVRFTDGHFVDQRADTGFIDFVRTVATCWIRRGRAI